MLSAHAWYCDKLPYTVHTRHTSLHILPCNVHTSQICLQIGYLDGRLPVQPFSLAVFQFKIDIVWALCNNNNNNNNNILLLLHYLIVCNVSLGPNSCILYLIFCNISLDPVSCILYLIVCNVFLGPISCILSSNIWIPVSKLTFSTFVCHGIWQCWYFYSQQTTLVITSMSLVSIIQSFDTMADVITSMSLISIIQSFGTMAEVITSMSLISIIQSFGTMAEVITSMSRVSFIQSLGTMAEVIFC